MTKLLLTIAGILILIEVFFLNQLAGGGRSVSAIDSTIEELQEKNARLEQQVASASSLLFIEQKAKESGFVEPRVSSYIDLGTLPIALVENQ